MVMMGVALDRNFVNISSAEVGSVHNFGVVEKKKVKYSAIAECEIIHFVNCEILLLRRNVK